MKIIYILSIIVMITFCLIGILVFSIAIHEFIHKIDLSSIAKSDETMCALEIPLHPSWYSGIGYYDFKYLNKSDIPIGNEITYYSEIKAYIVSIIIAIGIPILLLMSLYFYQKDKAMEENKYGKA